MVVGVLDDVAVVARPSYDAWVGPVPPAFAPAFVDFGDGLGE